MNVARVTGTLWATRKYEDMDAVAMQIIQPLTDSLEPSGKPIVAADTVGAGPGELVFYTTAYEAVIPFVTRRGGKGLGTLVPLDAAIVGIVEQWERGPGYTKSGTGTGTGTGTKKGKKK